MNVSGSTYLSHLVAQINLQLLSVGPTLMYGENINYGSRLSGLARGIDPGDRHSLLNVGNAELTHVGMGMGIMADGGNAVLFVKQSDFLMLGLDQMVNTYNYIRAYCEKDKLGSFTIYSIICDQGYQGPQSSMNAPQEFASLTNVETYCLNGAADSTWVMHNRFISPGFRLVFVSQKYFGAASCMPVTLESQSDGSIFKYMAGDGVTAVCTGFGLRHGIQVANALATDGVSSDLLHLNYIPGMDLSMIVDSCARTGRLLVLDDSKSVTKLGDLVVSTLKEKGVDFELCFQGRRGLSDRDYGVHADVFVPDLQAIRQFVRTR